MNAEQLKAALDNNMNEARKHVNPDLFDAKTEMGGRMLHLMLNPNYINSVRADKRGFATVELRLLDGMLVQVTKILKNPKGARK